VGLSLTIGDLLVKIECAQEANLSIADIPCL
jgi:hypothetical protein